MGAQQKYMYHYAYLDTTSFSVIENNTVYNDDRGVAEVLQNYNHNSLNLKFKAGEYTARALSVLLANNEVGLILKPVTHNEFTSVPLDVYDITKIGNITLNPNIHFYEVGGEFISNNINSVIFLTKKITPVNVGDVNSRLQPNIVTITAGDNDYTIFAEVLTNNITSFFYPINENQVELIDLRDLNEFSITFSGNSIPANFLTGYVNENCVLSIENAVSITKIGDNAFAGSKFANIIANFSGIRQLGSGVQFAKTGGTITTQNPLGLIPYDDLRIVLTSDVQEINGLIIASDFFTGSKKLLNDTCNALSHFKGTLTEIKNSTIVEDFKDLTNLDNSNVTFDNCTFAVNQNFNANPETRTLTIRNCNQQSTGAQVFAFTGFKGKIIIENSFKSAEASYVIDDVAAYSLEIDDNSFINAGISGSLNKVLPNQNRNLPPLVGSGAFLRINDYNILSFSGNNYLTIDGQLLTIDEITSLEFSIYKKWDLKNGNFAFTQWNLPAIYLYNSSDFKSYIKGFTNGSFFKMKMNQIQIVAFYILASQLLEILKCENCFTTHLTPTFHFILYIYNDLPSDFNYFEIVRNESSLKFENGTKIVITNDPDDLLRNALQAAYPEYVYEYY